MSPTRRRRRFPGLSLALLLPTAAGAATFPVPPSIRHALQSASVQLEPVGCSGVVAGAPDIVLTARHCVKQDDEEIDVLFGNGERRTGVVAALDDVADQAVLVLRDPAPVAPLALMRRTQIPGTVLYFEGNPARPRFQGARLDRIGRCESLPKLPNALFTSVNGVPGDSGAPLVDGAARVVGLVHGGARCHIATPGDTLGRLVDRVLHRQLVRTTSGRASLRHEAQGQRVREVVDEDVEPVLVRHRGGDPSVSRGGSCPRSR